MGRIRLGGVSPTLLNISSLPNSDDELLDDDDDDGIPSSSFGGDCCCSLADKSIIGDVFTREEDAEGGLQLVLPAVVVVVVVECELPMDAVAWVFVNVRSIEERKIMRVKRI